MKDLYIAFGLGTAMGLCFGFSIGRIYSKSEMKQPPPVHDIQLISMTNYTGQIDIRTIRGVRDVLIWTNPPVSH
jgi:hypothetical protein